MSLCVGAHGWVAGIDSHGSVLLSRGWLITVEAPGHPGHTPSTQLDAVVNNNRKSSQGQKFNVANPTQLDDFSLHSMSSIPSACFAIAAFCNANSLSYQLNALCTC